MDDGNPVLHTNLGLPFLEHSNGQVRLRLYSSGEKRQLHASVTMNLYLSIFHPIFKICMLMPSQSEWCLLGMHQKIEVKIL